MVHHGVSVTYTLFGYPGSSAPPCGAPLTYYSLLSPSFRGPKPSLSFSFLVRAVPLLPRPRCFAKQTFVSARSAERETLIVGGDATLIDGESSLTFGLVRLVLLRNRIYSRVGKAGINYNLINKFEWESFLKP